MRYRDPDTGRFITKERWEEIQEAMESEYEDWEDLEDFDFFEEDEFLSGEE